MRFSNGFLRGVAQCCCCCTLLFSVLTGFFILCKIKTRFATCDRPPFDADRSQKKSQKVAGEFVFEMGKRGRKKTQRCRNGPSFFFGIFIFFTEFFFLTRRIAVEIFNGALALDFFCLILIFFATSFFLSGLVAIRASEFPGRPKKNKNRNPQERR